MTSAPLVSVIITTYYRNELAKEAVESVLQQTYTPIEVILVDGSGERNAEAVAEAFDDVIYIPRDSDHGVVSDRNVGFEASSGEYIHFLDDDDKVRPSKIERQMGIIRTDEEVGVVYSGLYRVEDDKVLLPPEDRRGEFLEYVLRHQQPPCYPSNMLIERDLLEEILPLDPAYDGADDVVLITELAKRTQFDFVREDLLVRGRDEESMAVSMNAVQTRRRVIAEYDDLYAKFPREVRRTALAGTYLTEGQVHLKRKAWSIRATRAFGLAIYYHPGVRLDMAGAFLTSLFGRRAWLVARDVLIWIRKKGRR